MTYYIGSVPCTPADLKHWGLLGMKWGTRRFRNTDGTLTPEGKQRYKRRVSEMNDDELRGAIGRMRMETEYSRLKRELHQNSPVGKAITAGKIVANRIGHVAGTIAYSTIVPFASSFSREFGAGLGRVLTGGSQKKDEKKGHK